MSLAKHGGRTPRAAGHARSGGAAKKGRPRAPALLNRRARDAVQELAAQPTKHNLGDSKSTSRPAYFAPVLPESGRSTQQPMFMCRQSHLSSPHGPKATDGMLPTSINTGRWVLLLANRAIGAFNCQVYQ